MAAALQLVIVEDSEADAELVSRHLAKAGVRAEIRRVQTEQDFVTALKTRRPDLIISDFSLPQFDGLRALELAAVHAPEIPFIYVSGTIGEERAIDALRRGATDYVLKTNLSRLSSAVERALPATILGLDEVFAASDVVVVLLPLTERTVGLVDRSTLGLLRPGAFVVNVGRGSVIDEVAVAEALAWACR